MQKLHSLHHGFHQLIASEEFTSVMDNELDEDETFREKLSQFLNSKGTLFLISVLIILDCVVVVLILMLELEVLYVGKGYQFLHSLLHHMSLSILAIFAIEILFRIYARGLYFFKSVLEVTDALVIYISLIMDVVFTFYGSNTLSAGVKVVIVLRFWRITRIINGIIAVVRTNARQSIRRERRASLNYCRKLEKYKQLSIEQNEEIQILQRILLENNIFFHPVIIKFHTT
ncbi:unnamed protein product [Candidula unifasciata]|uniref:Voltage-gated hydrogen channel 1 n=1 Tax=Candidula unifasciata TaxID=100452 RepID=A0A8S3Z1D8_9EUPU|nr:unnamed protein product [Candidula unifasciata]